jgi:protein dithiol oxidoreductase (disulfide-forming)
MGRPIAVRHVAAWLALLSLAVAAGSSYAQTWTEGVHYFAVTPAQRTSVPAGKVEVMEVFSYACPACNGFQPVMKQLKYGLPANAQIVFLPASFIPAEDWPVFQRAYFTADALGIAAKTHDDMFNAVWNTGELAVSDPITHQLKKPLPSIEDIARFYARTAGVKPETFLATAKSFGVDTKMKIADGQIVAMNALSTPTIIVNGKYRLTAQNVHSTDELIALVKYLVAKESSPAATAKK